MAEKAKTETTPVTVYPVAELIDNHKVFGVRKDLATVAFNQSKKTAMSFDEAKACVEKFAHKEVK